MLNHLVRVESSKDDSDMDASFSKVVPKTSVEWLVVIVVVAILVALILPGAQWASSGTIEVPVRVVVFDAVTAQPIPDAAVEIVRAPPATEEFELGEHHQSIVSTLAAIDRGVVSVRTDEEGAVTIYFEFPTGASHVNPETRAHTSWYWVIVSAEEYGRVVLPLRHESMTTKSLREQGILQTYVGLVRQQHYLE